MITYEAALEAAKKLKPSIDNCQEHTDAYIFGCQKDDDSVGGDGPVVILKETGEAVNMVCYLDDYGGEFVREIVL